MRIEQRLANGRTAKTELSPREREIAELRRKGAKEMEIAARLNIAEGTVKAVEQRIRRKEMQRKQSRSA